MSTRTIRFCFLSRPDGRLQHRDAAQRRARALCTSTTRGPEEVVGVPGMLVDGELFLGFHGGLMHLENFLAGKDPLAGMDLTQSTTMVPGATRPQSVR